MNIFTEKIKETLTSVMPVAIIVLLVNALFFRMEGILVARFILGAVMVIIGLAVFLTGVDLGVTPIGRLTAESLTKSNKLYLVIAVGLILGFFITVAEPDLHILAEQVDGVTASSISKMSVVITVAVGIAVLLTTGMVRILFNIPLYRLLTVLYAIIFILSLFTQTEFLAISFDSSGATTGALTVPFFIALSVGVAAMKKDSKASEKDSFGLVAIASCGAIIGMMVMNIINPTENFALAAEETTAAAASFWSPFIENFQLVAKEIFVALIPFLILFLVFNVLSFKLSRRGFVRIMTGLIYTYIGLVIFLTGVYAGFMEMGALLGNKISSLGVWAVLLGLALGVLTILAEPAVHVLTAQIEEVTSGYVKKKAVLAALCIGVGFAVALSVMRILIPEIKLWHYLLPGYVIAIALSYIAPKIFVGMAFDAGGVATGPMTTTFILAFTQGIASATESADILIDGFGMIAMVAMMPIITLQILGLVFKVKSKKGGLVHEGR